ncbi:hypothetical protein EMCRGX_G011525 [Ephydatia muelleri]
MWGTRVVIPKVHQQKVQEEPRRIHVEFEGPFQGKCFLVIVNAYSKWRLWRWMKPPRTGQWMNCVLSLPGGEYRCKCHKWSSGMLHSNIKTSTAAQPGQLLIELPKRKTFYHRSHNGNIDDREASTMQTQAPDDRLEGISIIKCQIGAVKVCSC